MKKIRALWCLITCSSYFLVAVQKDDLVAKVQISDEDRKSGIDDYIKDLLEGKHNYDFLN